MTNYYIVPEEIMEQLIGVIDDSKAELLNKVCKAIRTERTMNELMFDLMEHKPKTPY